MQKYTYKGVEYDIKVVNGKPVAVYLNGKLITGPLADEIIKDFVKKQPKPTPAPTPKRPKP
ncbi:hypothetical protein [Mixta calida]|uniref:hypothetical protein n=1 Tax=Mixta calida TaxID=665913 RepID=UPI002914277C|nr:hypothetical protein [Mixta calida]MDU4288343.1 hypothetical protein [Mixta calida]